MTLKPLEEKRRNWRKKEEVEVEENHRRILEEGVVANHRHQQWMVEGVVEWMGVMEMEKEVKVVDDVLRCPLLLSQSNRDEETMRNVVEFVLLLLAIL
jgi:hypothetical protein